MKNNIATKNAVLAALLNLFVLSLLISFSAAPLVPVSALGQEPKKEKIQMLEKMIHELAEKHLGLDTEQLRISAEEVRAQTEKIKEDYDRPTAFSVAFVLAMRSFAEDGSTSESPLQLIQDKHGPADKPLSEQTARNILNEKYLSHPETTLSLVPLDNRLHEVGEKADYKVWPPEGGEQVEDYWIFLLEIPSLSDRLHWAVVEKELDSGSSHPQVYNYGYN
jgi:hypothetical protein